MPEYQSPELEVAWERARDEFVASLTETALRLRQFERRLLALRDVMDAAEALDAWRAALAARERQPPDEGKSDA